MTVKITIGMPGLGRTPRLPEPGSTHSGKSVSCARPTGGVVYVYAVNSSDDLPDGIFARAPYHSFAVPDDGGGIVGVVTVTGEIDMATEPILSEALDAAFNQPGTVAVVIDLSGVAFFGSPGVAALAVARTKADAEGVKVALVIEPDSATDRTLQILGMTQLLPTYPDRAAAIAAHSSDPEA